MQALQCKSCGAAMSSTGFDRRLGVVSCDHCGAIFDLTRRADRAQFTGELGAIEGTPPPDRAPVALPDRFRIQRLGVNSMVVSWRWFRPTAIFMICFAIGWDSFLFFWYAGALTQDDISWLMVLFPLGHVAAGVGVTYAAIANLLNRTRVICNKTELKVRHFPMPWFPRPTIPVQDLEQLYVTRTAKHGKNGTTVTFNLLAVTRNHSGQTLLEGLDSLEQALWLEQEFEGLLDIRDRPVAGEYQGELNDQV